ncbi:MAG: hypothetical protein BWK80_36855 [Desulfobacteraceae bacterium IS3]|nr:MAG: hypothetical protein BWK80_36855 [Desulfobacteraceae bacterium IS3]
MEEKNNNNLGIINKKLMSGQEELIYKNISINYKLIDFWKWSVSDLISNATRGRFAEFIVATALNININCVRDEWSAFDLTTNDGIKIEIKSSAFMQSWNQKKPSVVSFSIKRSKSWDPESNLQSKEKSIQADVYVFCLLKPKTKENINPLNMDQWGFYVLNKNEIENYKRSQHSITLPSLEKLTNQINYEAIKDHVYYKYKILN